MKIICFCPCSPTQYVGYYFIYITEEYAVFLFTVNLIIDLKCAENLKSIFDLQFHTFIMIITVYEFDNFIRKIHFFDRVGDKIALLL